MRKFISLNSRILFVRQFTVLHISPCTIHILIPFMKRVCGLVLIHLHTALDEKCWNFNISFWNNQSASAKSGLWEDVGSHVNFRYYFCHSFSTAEWHAIVVMWKKTPFEVWYCRCVAKVLVTFTISLRVDNHSLRQENLCQLFMLCTSPPPKWWVWLSALKEPVSNFFIPREPRWWFSMDCFLFSRS